MFGKFKINMIKIAAPLVLIVGVLIIVIYADNVFQKKNLSELEQKLFQVGKTYEFEIKKDLEQYQSIAELLTISFSKEVENNDFTLKAKGLIKTIMAKHKRISSATLVLKIEDQEKNNESLDLSENTDLKRVNLIKTENDEIQEISENEFIDLNIKAEIEKVIAKEQTIILSPVVKRIESRDVPVVPIVSSIFEGKRYLGYIILYTNIDWTIETKQFFPTHEAFVTANDGKLIALKHIVR